METKTYFASSVPAALEAARKDLGPDAMLVNSRPAPPEARTMGRLEVTFTYDPAHTPPEPVAKPVQFPVVSTQGSRYPAATGVERPAAERSQRVAEPGGSPFAALKSLSPGRAAPKSSELDDIRDQLAELRRSLSSSPNVAPDRPSGLPDTGTDPLVGRLVRSGMEPEFARDILAASSKRGRDRSAGLAAELVSRIGVEPFGGVGDGKCLAFVGPPGRGKSLSLVKIAFRYGLAAGNPVRIFSVGDHGVGGNAALARYAAILNIPFESCDSYPTADLVMGQQPTTGLVLIDTPGLSPSETFEIGELARFLRGHPEIEKHLVLRADARAADMGHIVSRFSSIGLDRLLFAAVEEALGLGPLVETLVRSAIPATFVGTGREMPGCIEELDAAKLVQAVCGDRNMAAAAA